jgi:8-oxo-dGTP diphosphatase
LIVYSRTAKLELKDSEDILAMAKKGKYVYDWPRPMVSVDAAVFKFFRGRAKLLLIKRGNEPFKGRWALPGGFVDIDEELEAAAARELAEETGLVCAELEQMRTFGRCGRDPRGRQITIVFMGVASRGQRRPKAGDDAAEAKWFDIGKLPKNLAFDHNEVTRCAVGRLKRKKIYQLSTRRTQRKTIKNR